MLRNRILVIIALVPLVVFLTASGEWVFSLFMASILGFAGWEFWRIFKTGGYSPSRILLIIGTFLVVFTRHFWGEDGSIFILGIVIMAAMAFHIFAYERGEQKSGSDFAITTAGIIYLGWFGSYFIALRDLPDGLWWTLLVLTAVAATDIGGFIFGNWLGRHKMSRYISPNKTWEGYFGGIFFAVLITASTTFLWQLQSPNILFDRGAWIALAVATFSPLGDFGESLFKRQFGVKDSGTIFSSHGGMLDRIDSWLWAAIIGYYLVHFFWIK